MDKLIVSKAKQDLRHADKLDGQSFEIFMVKVLNKVGYKDVIHTPASNDHGIDAYSRPDSIAWQFKNYAKGHKVPFHAVEECLFGSSVYKLKTNVVLTNSKFSKETISLVKKANHNNPNRPIILVDRTKLLHLFAKMEAHKPQVAKQVREHRRNIQEENFKDLKDYTRISHGLESFIKDSTKEHDFHSEIKQFAYYITSTMLQSFGYIPNIIQNIEKAKVYKTINKHINSDVIYDTSRANVPVFYMYVSFKIYGNFNFSYKNELFIYYSPEIIAKYYKNSYPCQIFPNVLYDRNKFKLDPCDIITNMRFVPIAKYYTLDGKTTENFNYEVPKHYLELSNGKHILNYGDLPLEDILTLASYMVFHNDSLLVKNRKKYYKSGKKDYLQEQEMLKEKHHKQVQKQYKIQLAKDKKHKQEIKYITSVAKKAKFVNNFFKNYCNSNPVQFLTLVASRVSHELSQKYAYQHPQIHNFNKTIVFNKGDYYPKRIKKSMSVMSHIVNNMYGENNDGLASEYRLELLPQKEINKFTSKNTFPQMNVSNLIKETNKKEQVSTVGLDYFSKMIFVNTLCCGVMEKRHVGNISYYYDDDNSVPSYPNEKLHDENYYIFDLNSIYTILKSLTKSKNKKQIKSNVQATTTSDEEVYMGCLYMIIIPIVIALVCFGLTDNRLIGFLGFCAGAYGCVVYDDKKDDSDTNNQKK